MIRKSIVRNHIPRDVPLEKALKIIRKAGYDGVQLHVGTENADVLLSMTDREVRDVARLVKDRGLKAHSLMPSLGRMIDPDAAARKETVDRFGRALEICKLMGIRVLLVHPGALNEACPYDLAYEWCTDAFKTLKRRATKARCCLAVENVWNKFLLSPLEARDFVDEFKSDAVGFYFDVGNIIPYGFAEQWIRILGRRIAEVHFKDFRRSVGTAPGFVPLLAGDVNWPAVMQELRAARYHGFVCAEVGSYPHNGDYQALKATSAAMDAILKMGKA